MNWIQLVQPHLGSLGDHAGQGLQRVELDEDQGREQHDHHETEAGAATLLERLLERFVGTVCWNG
jgi:hypothetical protein